jgi:CO/xanthine dehydrogenase Mo-binding subunit
MTQGRVIGQAVPRHDARDKILGKTRYAADFSMPGMLYGRVLRAPLPSARIRAIDTGAALALPGVEAVLTATDVPNNRIITRFGQTRKVGGFEGEYLVLAEQTVRYHGEAVALIAARTPQLAAQAAQLVQVTYDPLPGVFDPQQAMQAEAPAVGSAPDNIVCRYQVRKGDVAQGFAAADMVLEKTFRTQFIEHAYLEPEAGLAWVDDDQVVHIRVSTQVIEHYRGIARVLGVAENRVRVFGTMVGGGFGGKEDITVESYLALLAQKTGKPVKMVNSREESFIGHSKRHPFIMRYKLGARRDGDLLALEAELIADAGAYVLLSPWVMLYAIVDTTGPYRIRHVKADGVSVLTNNIPTSAMRTFGGGQVCFAYEGMLDAMAAALHMDPIALRQRNFLRKGESLASGHVLETHVALPETTSRALEALGPPSSSRGPIKVGRGLAASLTSYGRMIFLHDTSRAYVGLEMDGSVVVRAGVPDIGGGQSASLGSIAAETLGVTPADVTIYIMDSALTPLSGTTTATRQLYMSGNAVLQAATTVRNTLLSMAAELLGDRLPVRPDELDIADRRIFVRQRPELSLPMAQVVQACADSGLPLFHQAQFNAPVGELIDFERGYGRVFADFTFGSTAAEVEVDTETGRVRVRKLASCFDVGQAINRASVEGQIEGGAVMGIGWALTEDYVLRDGYTRTPTFTEYLIPTAMDTPEIQAIVLESGEGLGPFKARGIGEPSLTPVGPAIASAIYDAIGRQVTALPITPERVLQALAESLEAPSQMPIS